MSRPFKKDAFNFEDRGAGYQDYAFRHLIVERQFIRATGQAIYHLSAIPKAAKQGVCLLQDYWYTAGKVFDKNSVDT